MKKIITTIAVLSISLLPLIAQAHSVGTQTNPHYSDLIEGMQTDAPYIALGQIDDAYAGLPDSTISYLLEKENRAQIAEILTVIDNVVMPQ